MATVQQRNFREGQAAYNQFARNVAKLPALIKEHQNLLEAAEETMGEAAALHRRVHNGGPFTQYHQRKLNNLQARAARNYARWQAVNAEILNAKRRLLTTAGRRYIQNFAPLGPHHNGTLRHWNPARMIAAIRLPFKNKIYKAALRHAARPRTQVPKMIRNNKGKFVSN